ncbi:MAG: hypothetical protein AAB176_12855 [Pseudomonadota bacterium]
MTTPPIDRSRTAYPSMVPAGTEPTSVAQSSAPTGEPTAEALQQIDASASLLYPAGERASGEVSPLTASKASDVLQELSHYDGNLSDLLASMAATMAGIFQKLRKSAVEGKVAELKTQVNAMLGQAGKMRDAADKNYNAALIQGWSQFAGGAVGLAGGAVSAHASFKAGKELQLNQAATAAPKTLAAKTPADVEADGFDDLLKQAGGAGRPRADAIKGKRPADTASESAQANAPESKPAVATAETAPQSAGRVDLLNTRARLTTELSQSVGTMTTSMGGIFAAGQKQGAEMDEAQGKELEAQSTQAAANLAREEEFAQMWKEGLQRLLDNLKAAIDQEQATGKATIQNI